LLYLRDKATLASREVSGDAGVAPTQNEFAMPAVSADESASASSIG